MELMLCAGAVFAAVHARIGCQHARYGLVPGWGGSQRLPRLIGLRRALEPMYSARWLDAETAERWGLVNHVVDDQELRSEAGQFARQLGEKNPEGVAAMKQLARGGEMLTVPDAMAFEQSISVPALMSENAAEGLNAFRERREPSFRDKPGS